MNPKAGIRVSAALAVTACALLFVPTASSAATTGSIAGTVTAASGGAALKGIEVCAYEVGGEEEACILTSASGEYTISGLAPAEYKVEFWSHREGLNYVTQYYSNKSTFAAAETVTVTSGGTSTGVNAQLQKGGGIAGTLTDAATHAPLAGVFVCTLEPVAEEILCALTGASGQYTIAGLPSGFYEVVFAPQSKEEELPGTYITQYYNDQPTFATADLVPVTVPATTFNIDAALVKRPAVKAPTIPTPPVIAPAPVPPPVVKPKPLTCKKGFKKKKIAGKAKCIKVHHHRRHKRAHH